MHRQKERKLKFDFQQKISTREMGMKRSSNHLEKREKERREIKLYQKKKKKKII